MFCYDYLGGGSTLYKHVSAALLHFCSFFNRLALPRCKSCLRNHALIMDERSCRSGKGYVVYCLYYATWDWIHKEAKFIVKPLNYFRFSTLGLSYGFLSKNHKCWTEVLFDFADFFVSFLKSISRPGFSSGFYLFWIYLERARDKFIAIFDQKKKKKISCKHFPVFGHQNPGPGYIFSLKCWLRIRNQWIRIRNTEDQYTQQRRV